MEITKTEALVVVNKLKDRHEQLKKEILDLAVAMKEKEDEMLKLEEEYAKHIIYLVEK